MIAQKTIIPDGLQPGDTIGIVAPGGAVDLSVIQEGQKALERMGFTVMVPDDLLAPQAYLAAPDRKRAEVFNRMFEDKTISGIICARGGFGAMRMLPYVDFALIQRHPKIVVGFSDVSALLVNIYQRSHVVTYHGPVMITLPHASDMTLKMLEAALLSGPSYRIDLEDLYVLLPGRVKGQLIGGNLSTLCHLAGTPYMPSFVDHVVFLEDVNEPLYKIDRMLTQIQLTGAFDHIKGVILGRFEKCGDVDSLYALVQDKLISYGIPIVAGVAAGHVSDNLTLPIGFTADIDTNAGTVSISY